MKKAYIVTGLGFGDEGKGTIVDYLTKEKDASLIVKFNGGPQAAHNVHTIDGKHHTFSQFGSGSFHPGVKTYLSKYVSVDPLAMLEEGKVLYFTNVEVWKVNTIEEAEVEVEPEPADKGVDMDGDELPF